MKNNDIKVSVIIPVYNAEKYLRQCLDSICGQTIKDIEIICVDDGSTDSSPEILREYKEKDERVIVVRQENAGAGAARNKGLDLSKGKYLSFLDADDFFEPDMLEEAFRCAEADKADYVVFNSGQYNTEEDEYNYPKWVFQVAHIPPYTPFTYRQLTRNIFRVFVGWAWDKLYLRDFVIEHGLRFQEQRTSNDLLFVFSALVVAKRISVCRKVLVHQRRDSSDSLSKTREKSWHCFYDALTALRERIISEGKYKELEKDFINYALHFTLWNYNSLAEPTKSKLYDKLTGGWLEDLGISTKPEEYFTEKNDYKQYRELFLAEGNDPEKENDR